MGWSDYWQALSARQRTGLIAGAVLIVVMTLGLGAWLLHDPYVPLASGLESDRLNDLAQELDRAKLGFRVAQNGDAIEVRRSQLGKARAAAAAGAFEIPASVGLELFQETDFSSTDFAQRINYQRALQGELTRTIQTMAGVRSARVHVILPEQGLFRREAAKASAAVSVTMQPGKVLARAQVLGIQRLVAASVPEIRMDDVVVLDESGASLSRAGSSGEGELTSAQLDLKRQADQYLESKLARLLRELVPDGTASLSVDTTLDERQLRITTEEPVASRLVKDSAHPAGVLLKERQSQRGHVSGMMQTDGYSADADSTDWEYEYKVGNRVEQTLSAPGSIKRISVAVALQGAPPELSKAEVEELVAHAVGIDRSRGDSVGVLMLQGVPTIGGEQDEAPASSDDAVDGIRRPAASADAASGWNPSALAVAIVVAALIALLAFLAWTAVWRRRATDDEAMAAEVALTKVREWLAEGTHGRS